MNFLFCLLGLASFAVGATAQTEISNQTARRIRTAGEVFTDRMQSALPIPDYVLAQTRCIASLKVVKAGFIWGGEGSTGLVSCRVPGGGWSTPSFLNVGGVTFGVQIGIQFIESVITFMTQTSQDVLNHTSFKIGADLSFSAGPVGQGSGAGFTPRTALLTYDKTRGLYAGATIEGFVISHGLDRNEEVYGPDITPTQLLTTSSMQGPRDIEPYVIPLTKHAP